MVDKGGVEPLITLLNDAKQLVQANAAVCLTNLATEGMLSYSFSRGVESGRGVSGVQYLISPTPPLTSVFNSIKVHWSYP